MSVRDSRNPEAGGSPFARARPSGRLARQAWEKLTALRTPRQTEAFVRWLGDALIAGLDSRLVQHRFCRKHFAPLFVLLKVRRLRHLRARRNFALRFGIVAAGPRARAIFAAAGPIPEPDAGLPELVVSDDPGAGAGEPDGPKVVLAHAPPALSVPAFDPRADNPLGWPYWAGRQVAALGARELLPPGVEAHRVARPAARRVLRHAHHVEDVAAWHADPIARAGALARLAANGVVVHLADGGPELAPLLGAELHALMTREARDLDLDARERLSIRMRRLALRDHSLRARIRQLCDEARYGDPPPLPKVSILLVTRRPALLAHALASVARQTWPRLELALGLHGEGFDPAEVERRVSELRCPVKVVRVEQPCMLGAVLNLVTERASGTLLTKMDDDDVYDAEHVRDLVLAYEYSGADLVGKKTEFIHLGGTNRTLHMRWGRNEVYTRGQLIGGGALLLSRRTLDDMGGWRRALHEDQALMESITRAGGSVYQLHGAGFVLVRHGVGHTWEMEEEYFLANPHVASAGWDPAMCGIGEGDAMAAPPSGALLRARGVA